MSSPRNVPRIPAALLDAAADAPRRYRLLEVVRARLRNRRYSTRTEEAYVAWIRRYVIHHGRQHPQLLGVDTVRDFLSSLTLDGRVSASTQNQALAALKFLYEGVLGRSLVGVDGIAPARRARHVPVVLSQREVRVLLARLKNPVRLCGALMYGSGLRLSECLSVRVKDVDLDRREIVVRGGKGGKDRRTPLAVAQLPELRTWLRERRREFERDVRQGTRCTGISPTLLRSPSTPIGAGRGGMSFRHGGRSCRATACGPHRRADDDDLYRTC